MENLYMETEVRKIFIFRKKSWQERDRRWISGMLVILSYSLPHSSQALCMCIPLVKPNQAVH